MGLLWWYLCYGIWEINHADALWCVPLTQMNAFFSQRHTRILFHPIGSKPVTIFGPMAAFQRDSIRKGFEDKYGCIAADLNTPKKHQGLLHFIADEVIDLKTLKEKKTSTTTSQATEPETIPLVEIQSPGPSQLATSSRNLNQSLGIEESELLLSTHKDSES